MTLSPPTMTTQVSAFRRRLFTTAGAGLGAALLLTGCQGSGAFASLQQNLSNLNDQQTQIIAKLDGLEKKIDAIEIPAAAPARPGADAKKPSGPKPGRPDATSTYKVDLGEAYAKGNKDALVTIIAWSDFQCPYCKRVVPTLTELEKAYGDDLRVAFKHNPLSFHNRAMPAAKAAEAAGKQGKFWEMHDKLFENNKEMTDDNFVKWAEEIGLDVAQFKKDMADPALEKRIKEQQAQGMTLGARGTPAFFVNGRFLSGAQPVDSFKKVIDEEMKKADKLIAARTPKDKVYDKTIEKGLTKP